MLFENNDFDVNMSLFMNDVFSRDNNILSPMEGFLRGNMFKDEYKPYKNFALNDLNLYLDLHPDNKEVFDLFKKYVEERKKLVKEYTKNYGPLTVSKTTGTKFNWIDSPWPWDNKGGDMYV